MHANITLSLLLLYAYMHTYTHSLSLPLSLLPAEEHECASERARERHLVVVYMDIDTFNLFPFNVLFP